MLDERRKRAEEAFQRAVELPAEARAAFLDEQCGTDTTLRAEVDALLSVPEGSLRRFLPTRTLGPPGGSSERAETADLPQRIGRYTVVRKIGEGGMGVVYEAQQEHPHRRVALKVIRPGRVSEDSRRRFERETEALGQLQHSGIAQIYEAGTALVQTRAGLALEPQPFFAMELVQGQLLMVYMNSHSLGTREKLDLVAKICDAIQHAHQRGVIHRDLKPANILVTEDGQPKILDFGVAHLTEMDLQTATLQTDVGQLIGTVPYMSPEQLSGDPRLLDTRSDVYALGVVCYEVLAGRLPFDVAGKLVVEAARIIREDEPTPLSSVNRIFRGDLETIVSKALAKEKDRRYHTASEFASDIRRHLSDEPILARPPSWGYQLHKFASRNVGLVAGVASAFTILVLAFVVTGWLALRERDQRRLAEKQTGLARRAEDRAEESRASAEAAKLDAEQERDAANLARDAERRQRELLGVKHYAATCAAVDAAIRAGDLIGAAHLLEQANSVQRHWEWHYLKRLADPSLATMRGHSGTINSVAFGPDGSRIVSGGADSEVIVWTVSSADGPVKLSGTDSPVVAVAFPDAAHVASLAWSPSSASPRPAWTFRSWDLRTNTCENPRIFAIDPDSPTAVSADSSRLAFVADDRIQVRGCASLSVEVVDPFESKASMRELSARFLAPLALSGDGSRLLCGLPGRGLGVWDVGPGLLLSTISQSAAHAALSADGRQVALLGPDFTISIRDAESGVETALLQGHTGRIECLAYSPDGSWLASGAMDCSIRIWNTHSGKASAELFGHESVVSAVTFSRDGHYVASGSWDNTVRLWDANDARLPNSSIALHTVSVIRVVALSPDGSHLAVGGDDGMLRLVDVSTAGQVELPGPKPQTIGSLAFSPNGEILAAGSWSEDEMGLWDVQKTCAVPGWGKGRSAGESILFNTNGSCLAARLSDDTVAIWDVPTGQQIAATGWGQPLEAIRFGFSQFGSQMVTGSVGSTRRVWGAPAVQDFAALGFSDKPVVIAFANGSAGPRMVVGGANGTIMVWDVSTWQVVATLRAPEEPIDGVHRNDLDLRRASKKQGSFIAIQFDGCTVGAVASLALSRDGTQVAAGFADGTIRTWDLADPARGCLMHGHDGDVYALAFSPDGARLVSGGADGLVRLWHPMTGDVLATLRGHDHNVLRVFFTSDGSRIVSVSNNDVWIWRGQCRQPIGKLPAEISPLLHPTGGGMP